MLNDIITVIVLLIIGIASVVGAVIILSGAVANLRDQLVNRGIIPENWKLAQSSIKSQKKQALRVLREIGITEEDRLYVETVLPRGNLNERIRKKPAEVLLSTLKRWTRILEPELSNPGSGQYYIDTMGAMHFSQAHELSLPEIMQGWIKLLIDNKIIKPFHFMLTPKIGNVIFTQQVCSRLKRSPFFFKSKDDPSRVVRTDGGMPHETDFEGLNAFLEEHGDNLQDIRGIAISDNCTTGSSICGAIQQFNEYIRRNASISFNPIDTAVVLFTVKSDATHQIFQDAGATLYSLLDLGEKEMERIFSSTSSDALIKDISLFKEGFVCEISRRYGW